MKAIRFLIDCPGESDGRPFSKGSAHLLNDASAWHWVRRDKAEYIEHTPVAELPPDPVVVVVGEPVAPSPLEVKLARVDEILANPPSVLAPLIEKSNGDALDSAVKVVEKPDGADTGVGAKSPVMPAGAPASGGRSQVRGNRS